MATMVERNPKAPFSIATALWCRIFLEFTFDHYLVKLSVKQSGIKYHF